MYKYPEGMTGEFVEKTKGNIFSYRTIDSEFYSWARDNGLPHIVYVADTIRYAKVLKTVAYIAVDEDSDGKPVLEKWDIKNHVVYSEN